MANNNENNQAMVHIVDDDEAILDAMSMLLDSVGLQNRTYQSAQHFLDTFNDQNISQLLGCLILDIRMPGMSGLQCQSKLEEMGCPLPIIFVTGHGDVPMAVEALKKGAWDFIQKPFREQHLLDCIQQALNVSQTQYQSQLGKNDINQRLSTLTTREKEVMDKVILGQANKVIAADLNLSQRTIEIHRANVMDKMQAKSLAELVKMVISVDSAYAENTV
ncbi:response regulator transcription factor [Alteromonadaceae bacterium BrNp21-10]|nr:response regulator transcription factor [Alteromonadaceae bacterium BrNp21-10]